MTTIKVTCQRCGDITLNPPDLYIELRGCDLFYEFECFKCHRKTARPTTTRIKSVLEASGVRTIEEVFEAHLRDRPYIPEEWL